MILIIMTGSAENSEFCFLSASMFLLASRRGTLRVSGKAKLTGAQPLYRSINLLFNDIPVPMSARAQSDKMNNDVADGHCYSFSWI